METAFYIVIAVAQVGILVYYFWNNARKKKKVQEGKSALAREYPYEGMRNIALNTAPGVLLASIPENEILVYCVVMDWDMGSDTVTLVGQVTGEANLYVKSGGGVIGAGKYANISTETQQLNALAQQELQKASPAAGTTLPGANEVQFFMLTNRGKFVMKDVMKNIENKSSVCLPLYEQASRVIAEMRRTAMN